MSVSPAGQMRAAQPRRVTLVFCHLKSEYCVNLVFTVWLYFIQESVKIDLLNQAQSGFHYRGATSTKYCSICGRHWDLWQYRLCFAAFLQRSTAGCRTRGHSSVWLLSWKQPQILYIPLSVKCNDVPSLNSCCIGNTRAGRAEQKCALCTLHYLKSLHGLEKLDKIT